MVESVFAETTVVPLCDLRPGQVGCIAGITGYPTQPQSRRLRDLGFLPGTRVCLLRRAPLQDPAVFALRGYQMALRRCESECVMVRVESTADPQEQAS